MDNVLLPSYYPANYKPGHSGDRDRAEQWPVSKLDQIVCLICHEVTCKTKTGLDRVEGNLCANNTRGAHNIETTVQSGGGEIAHSDGVKQQLVGGI